MRKITLDDDLKAKLGDLADEIALCDAAGNVVACVVPPGHREMLYSLAGDLFSDEELERAEQEDGGMTTAEVLAHLETLNPHTAEQGAV
jgi:hypothetical protein